MADSAKKPTPARRARKSRATKKPAAKPAPGPPESVEGAPPEITDGVAPMPASEAPNAVIVHRSFGDDGRLRVSLGVLGDVKPTEIQTILEAGVKQVRVDLGIDKPS